MHPKNSITPPPVQALRTASVGFCDTPIDNQAKQMMQVMPGIDAADALQQAKVLSSGLGQLCRHLHDSLNMGESAYCDGVEAMAFLAETVSALVWAVQKGQNGEAIS